MSADKVFRTTIATAVRLAGERTLPKGWLFLGPGEDGPARAAIVVPHSLCDDEQSEEKLASALGYPKASLCTEDLEQVADGAKFLTPNPTEVQFWEAYAWYCEHDSFLPAFGAPPPPPLEESMRVLDAQFCETLGPERENTVCRHEGCGRGTVKFSVLCRKHHFESVQNRPYPFED